MKEKLTLTYILISIMLVAGITFYFAKIDISKMNSDITKGGTKAFTASEEYSKKLYNLAVSKLRLDDAIDKDQTTVAKPLVISTSKKIDAAKVIIANAVTKPIKIDHNATDTKAKKKVIKAKVLAKAKTDLTFTTKKEQTK